MALTVTAINDAPVAQDQSAVMDERTVLLGTIVATDVDSSALTYRVVTTTARGVLTVDPGGEDRTLRLVIHAGAGVGGDSHLDPIPVLVRDGVLSMAVPQEVA